MVPKRWHQHNLSHKKPHLVSTSAQFPLVFSPPWVIGKRVKETPSNSSPWWLRKNKAWLRFVCHLGCSPCFPISEHPNVWSQIWFETTPISEISELPNSQHQHQQREFRWNVKALLKINPTSNAPQTPSLFIQKPWKETFLCSGERKFYLMCVSNFQTHLKGSTVPWLSYNCTMITHNWQIVLYQDIQHSNHTPYTPTSLPQGLPRGWRVSSHLAMQKLGPRLSPPIFFAVRRGKTFIQ